MRVIRDLNQANIVSNGAAVTIGNFDGLHLGHQALINAVLATAAEEDLLSTLVSFEPLPRQFFDRTTQVYRLQSTTEKLFQLRQWGLDQTILLRFNKALAQLSAEDFIEQILIAQLDTKVLFVGDDFRFGEGRRGDFDLLQKFALNNEFSVHSLPPVCAAGVRVSSTRLRAALEAGYMPLAADFLGQPFSLSGRVVKGQQLGRKLGYPTANIPMHNRPCPVAGVFAVIVETWEGAYPGVASIGNRPAIGGTELLLEAHLFDFSADLYGQRIKVNLIERIRAEEHFSSLDELTEKMQQDELQAIMALQKYQGLEV